MIQLGAGAADLIEPTMIEVALSFMFVTTRAADRHQCHTLRL
jgi:hypothetical protein